MDSDDDLQRSEEPGIEQMMEELQLSPEPSTSHKEPSVSDEDDEEEGGESEEEELEDKESDMKQKYDDFFESAEEEEGVEVDSASSGSFHDEEDFKLEDFDPREFEMGVSQGFALDEGFTMTSTPGEESTKFELDIDTIPRATPLLDDDLEDEERIFFEELSEGFRTTHSTHSALDSSKAVGAAMCADDDFSLEREESKEEEYDYFLNHEENQNDAQGYHIIDEGDLDATPEDLEEIDDEEKAARYREMFKGL